MTTVNQVWAALVVEELIRNGVDFFCLAPGSRSTPLTMAVAQHPKARSVMHFDERGTAFCALGYGRATGRPAAWITTSGTALANGFPAIVEAATDGVPMLLLTADRPPEQRHTGANQTIDQVKLFGDYVGWFFDLPTPTTAIDPAMVLTTVDQAVYRALRAPQGPVHLNCMFREPLAPPLEGDDDQPYVDALAAWHQEARPYTRYGYSRHSPHPEEIDQLWQLLCHIEQVLLVVGRLDTRAQGEAIVTLAERLGWPLLPDVGSQLRLGHRQEAPTRIGYYDQVLRSPSFTAGHPVSAVLHLGGRPTSKRLLQYLDRCRPASYIVVNDSPARLDPNHQVTLRLEADITTFCNALTQRIPQPQTRTPWLSSWQAAAAQTAKQLTAYFAAQGTLSEPLVARLVSEHIEEGHGLVLASSMPVRDMDMFGALDGPGVTVAANRGASGIDGTVATAVGVSEGLQAPVTLVIGDLALLHDLNSLALLRTYPVTVVVINNDGGGIFHFLPIAQHEDVFEPFFGTPHGITFEAAAALFGLTHHQPDTAEAFVSAYQEAIQKDSGTLIEVKTERQANRALHQHLHALIEDSLTVE